MLCSSTEPLCIYILTSEQPFNILGLPNEILVELCESAEGHDLSSMRLTCRRLNDAAIKQFAVVNFTERVHVVTPYSIDALINITKHPTFAKYVKTIGTCSARRSVSVKGPPRRSVALNGYITTRRFARAMEQVFKIIRDRSGSVAITIYDNPGMGNLGNWSGHRLSTRPTPIKCHGWADLLRLSSSYITYRTAETFEQTVYAARRVKCRITCLKMDLFTGYNSLAKAQIQQAMQEILESTPTPLSVNLGRNRFPKLSYDRSSQSVEMRDIVYLDTIMNAGFNIPVDTLYAWTPTQRVTQLKVDLIDNYTPACLQAVSISRECMLRPVILATTFGAKLLQLSQLCGICSTAD
jgi:hypothetical protein